MPIIDFQQEVLERSQEVPVVVDFWAAWCGPCRVLGPVIEGLADEAQGRWDLVKLDTEAQPDISRQYQIMSIPAVKMFYKGEVIADFVGALPRHSIVAWLDEHLPDDRKAELDLLIQSLQSEGPDRERMIEGLQIFSERNPDLIEARVALAKAVLFQAPEKSLQWIQDIQLGNKYFDQAEQIRDLSNFIRIALDSSSPAGSRMVKAQEALSRHEEETAIQQIIEAVMLDKSFSQDLPRKTAIALFQYWGPEHPLTQRYRKRFDMALY